MFLILGSPYQPNEAADAFRQVVIAALREANISLKEAAITMGLSSSVLSRQLAGAPHTHLSLWRLAALPETFWNAFDAQRAEARGAVLLAPHLVVLLRGAANLKRELVKAALPQKARQAS